MDHLSDFLQDYDMP